jgi:hypothetical protein
MISETLQSKKWRWALIVVVVEIVSCDDQVAETTKNASMQALCGDLPENALQMKGFVLRRIGSASMMWRCPSAVVARYSRRLAGGPKPFGYNGDDQPAHNQGRCYLSIILYAVSSIGNGRC